MSMVPCKVHVNDCINMSVYIHVLCSVVVKCFNLISSWLLSLCELLLVWSRMTQCMGCHGTVVQCNAAVTGVCYLSCVYIFLLTACIIAYCKKDSPDQDKAMLVPAVQHQP